jgi:hypothetical protein
LRSEYPQSFIKLDKIKLDGKEVSYDGNKILYGDLESNGNYRIEIFNVYGNTKLDSPFGGGEKTSEPALACDSEIEITYTIVNLDKDYGTNLLGAELTIADNNYTSGWPDAKALLEFNGSVAGAQQSIKAIGSVANGYIVLVDLNNAVTMFPNMKLRLDEVLVDGESVPFDADKIMYGDIESKGTYRIELFNHWGDTSKDNPWNSFDEATESVPALGYKSSFEVKYTVLNLF